MPVQAAQWTEFLSCPICYNEFDGSGHKPISLGCSHTVCKTCLHKLHRKACPFDQTAISTDIDLLPVNCALLQLVGAQVTDQTVTLSSLVESKHYEASRQCVEELALYLKPISGGKGVTTLSQSVLSRPMQRKLVTLVNCQLVEEEGRVRAMRAGRSLGERTVTELILQHQNPQQLSANLWAAVRARGCQFLGPAMQEDALKLVLLALEDGSALSRKVLVLFVVQKLEARFPQASKTSIGHVVQLLYRASCFKVTKRDEDSSLMQLKEEFRTYEALRREHDAQIVHIAMEAGLRISPEQWSSLLYGDLVHKSHMQSIIDKLQSPESFAKSVQELTIVLQRTGDPANLNSLRPHLELLANIDHNPDAASPSWEQLEQVMLAVKLVVHSLVDFIQNFSKKSHEAPQPQPNSKYKTSMCRDLRQQGGCPRGANCTFAHSQDELEKFRMRNKKISGAVRPFPLPQAVLGKTVTSPGNVPAGGVSLGGPEGTEKGASPTESMGLIPRGGETLDKMKRAVRNGSNGVIPPGLPASGPSELKPISPPKTPVSHICATSPHAPGAGADSGSAHPKHGHFIARGAPFPPQQSDVYFQDPQAPYDTPPYHPASNYYASPVPPLKQCTARFFRNVPESSLPPAMAPYSEQHPPFPPRERLGPAPYPPPPQYGHLTHAHGVYAPVYDSRRLWRPQLYHREDARSNSLPPEVLHSSVYQTPLRERYNSLDASFCSDGEQRAALQRDMYSHVPVGYEDLFRRKPEQWAQHQLGNRPSPSSPLFTVDFSSELSESGGGDCVGCKYRGEENLTHYSPWSCGTISTCISSVESDPPVMATSTSELTDLEARGLKHRLHSFEPPRRLKDEDPIIPFGEGPIISKWGAISRASRTGYHTTDPVQATASQGRATTTPINFRGVGAGHTHPKPDYGPYHQSDYRWSSHGCEASSHSCFLQSDQLGVSELSACCKSSSSREKQNADLLQAEYCEDTADRVPDRDIELELSALDMEDSSSQDDKAEESHDLRMHSHGNHHSNGTVTGNGHQRTQPDTLSPDKTGAHLLKKMAFRKSGSPTGLGVMKTGPSRVGEVSHPSAGAEMLLNS
ncbi:roquin-2 isoform X1 [Anguilla anguilla]|uniref:roquin-2 isoform X1 n=1 Tax=Anguilla anguilla TaxID=7936 RepID=UPI0015A983AF|nr:roquin-2 isoform X1 [Anguilla anguilla]XP_035246823.1 roquin-2 isoform X1 [Anguilla anguilla]